MNEILMLSALVLAALLLAGAVVWCMLDRSRAGDATRATIDAVDRARNGLSQEMRSGDAALEAAIDRYQPPRQQIGQQVADVRRDQADALADQRRLIEGRQNQSEELKATRYELRDRLDGLRDSQAGALKLVNEGSVSPSPRPARSSRPPSSPTPTRWFRPSRATAGT